MSAPSSPDCRIEDDHVIMIDRYIKDHTIVIIID